MTKNRLLCAAGFFCYGQLSTPSAQRQPPQAGWVFPMQSSRFSDDLDRTARRLYDDFLAAFPQLDI